MNVDIPDPQQETVSQISDNLESLEYLMDEIDDLIHDLSGPRALAHLDSFRKKLDHHSEQLKDDRKTIAEAVLAIWEIEGTTSQKVDGVTVHLTTERWAKPRDGDRAKVVKVLEELGMADFVNFNTQSLSSYVRKSATYGGDEEYDIPQELQDVIEVTEDFKVKTRGH